jgi:hypothetical protein
MESDGTRCGTIETNVKADGCVERRRFRADANVADYLLVVALKRVQTAGWAPFPVDAKLGVNAPC